MPPPHTMVITGAGGFIGKNLLQYQKAAGKPVLALLRSGQAIRTANEHDYKPYDTQHNRKLLQGVEILIHCAARVHQVQDAATDLISAYRQDNRDATLLLANAAAQAGVRRFVFLSSVKVNGEFTKHGQAFRADDLIDTQDPYGISKWEAEQGLRDIAAKTGMEVVIIRPPLVYGPGVKANFLTMMQWLQKGIPLPLGSIHNRRSFVALPNLVDFISLCVTHPQAANQTFMISDQHDLSTTELLRGLGQALDRPARLLPVPQALLEMGLKVIGKAGIAQRLCGNLAVDASPATQLLGWKPPVTVQQGLQLTADHFLQHQTA